MANLIVELTHAEVQTILIEHMAEHYNLDYNDEDADVTFEVDPGGQTLRKVRVRFEDVEDFEDTDLTKSRRPQWGLIGGDEYEQRR